VTRIDVLRVRDDSDDPAAFEVTLTDDDGSSTSCVVRIDAKAASLAQRFPTLEAFVDACFRFLFEREPKESILRSFDASVIGRYFPEWQEELGGP
jgi:hypothetical protein